MSNKHKKVSKLLLDGDLICWRVSASKEHPVNWGGGLWTLHSFEEECYLSAQQYIEHMKFLTDIDSVEIVLSHTSNFRKELYPDYKANRKDVRKPLCFRPLREWLLNEYPTIIYDNLEADDTMGILASDSRYEYALISDDKDMMTVPSTHYVPKNREWINVTEAKANYHFFMQTLTGDTTDNYKGAHNVGAVGAAKVLAGIDPLNEEAMWKAVIGAYTKAKQTPEDALLNARLARILRAGEYNHVTNEPRLWNPPVLSE
jgi:DNA polymerase-1